jgi:hypothetical protein
MQSHILGKTGPQLSPTFPQAFRLAIKPSPANRPAAVSAFRPDLPREAGSVISDPLNRHVVIS